MRTRRSARGSPVAGRASPVASAPQPSAPAAEAATAPALPTVQIPPGGSILAAARDLYGEFPDEIDTRALLSEIQRLNPGLRDVNVVKAGATVKFPQVTTQSETREQPAE